MIPYHVQGELPLTTTPAIALARPIIDLCRAVDRAELARVRAERDEVAKHDAERWDGMA